MTLLELENEFNFKYDAASNGGPDLNSYEISLCLTQACKDIIDDAYEKFESNERSKRILAPLLKEHNSTVTLINDTFVDIKTYSITLPTDLQYIVREEAKLDNCISIPKVEITDLDYLSTYLNNPFKRPNKRKIIKVEYNGVISKIYSKETLLNYRIKYIKLESPIIIMDLTSDPTLIGNETISGLTGPVNTELPDFIHDEIIDKAVIIAIKTLRNNNLQTQIGIT